MLLRFFRSTGAQVLIIIPLIGLLLWLPSLIKAPAMQLLFDKAPMPLYKMVTDWIPYQSFIATAITFILVLFQGFLLVRLNTRFIFINNRTYFPALFFILLTASFPELQRLNPVIFSGFFLLLALEKILEAYKASKVAYEFFMAAFYLGIGGLFYPFLLFFILVLWIALAILKPFNWREWMFTILGFILPIYFVSSYYYIVQDQPFRIWYDFIESLKAANISQQYSVLEIIFSSILLVLVGFASQYMAKTYSAKKILPRKAFTIFLWVFINSLAVFVLVKNASAELIFIVAIPLSYLLANYFALIRSEFWGSVFLLVILLMLAAIQLF